MVTDKKNEDEGACCEAGSLFKSRLKNLNIVSQHQTSQTSRTSRTDYKN